MAARARPLASLAVAASPSVPVVRGLRRFRYLMLAAGSFALTFVAIMVPGLPTVPFLLATSYYLARSSPRLDTKLMHTVFFGPILEEWEHHGGLSRRSKAKLIGMSLTIFGISISITSLSPVTFPLVVVLFAISVTEIVRMPSITGPLNADPATLPPARLALPAP